MDDRKICFISCVNDDDIYRETQFYLNQLVVPYGFSIEFVAVRGAKSMTSGYNTAMRKSDAKYKVYLHQDVFIVNKNFIENIVDIFREDDNIGALGMIGCGDIPRHGTWWTKDLGPGNYLEATSLYPAYEDDNWINPNIYGAVYQAPSGRAMLSGLSKATRGLKYVDAKLFDGFLIATQHNLFWQENVFDKWHFYDLSQSCEFLEKGYRLVIPTQEKDGFIDPWCIHYGKNGELNDAWEIGRRKFITFYADLIARQYE